MRCCAPSLQQRSSFLLVRRKSTKSSDPDVMRRLVAARHAAQGFLPTPVDDAVLQDVLEMTRRSPSSFNSQPWSCVIVQDAAQRERLAAAMLGGNTFKYEVQQPCTSNIEQRVAQLPAMLGLFGGEGRVANVLKQSVTAALSPLRAMPTLSSTEAWSFKQTAIAAQTFMLAATAHGE
eukprot:15474-Heterococcus_DN1.PRE.3